MHLSPGWNVGEREPSGVAVKPMHPDSTVSCMFAGHPRKLSNTRPWKIGWRSMCRTKSVSPYRSPPAASFELALVAETSNGDLPAFELHAKLCRV